MENVQKGLNVLYGFLVVRSNYSKSYSIKSDFIKFPFTCIFLGQVQF